MKKKQDLTIDYPRQDEVVRSGQYSFRISAREADRVAVSIDDGPWLPCRPAEGYWWFDWNGYGDGRHALAAKVVGRDGETYLSETRAFDVQAGGADGGPRQVRQYMTRGIDSIRPDSTIKDAALAMRRHNVGTLPVFDKNDMLVGMITDRDIAVRAVADAADPTKTRVRDVMTPEPICCYEDQDLGEVARLMESRQVRRLPVMNRENRPVGMLSLGDFARRDEGKGILPEVVGAVAAQHR